MGRKEFPLYSLQGDILSLLRDWPEGTFPSKRKKVKDIYDNLTNYLETRTVKNLEESKETREEIKENFNKAMRGVKMGPNDSTGGDDIDMSTRKVTKENLRYTFGSLNKKGGTEIKLYEDGEIEIDFCCQQMQRWIENDRVKVYPDLPELDIVPEDRGHAQAYIKVHHCPNCGKKVKFWREEK